MSRTPDYAAMYEAPALFDLLADESGKIKSRRPNSDSTANHLIPIKTHVSPLNSIPSKFTAGESAEIRTKLSGVGINGPIKSVKVMLDLAGVATVDLITPTATSCYPQLALANVYYKLGQGTHTLPRDAKSIALENCLDMTQEDLIVNSDAIGFATGASTWAPHYLNTTNRYLIDVTGPLRGKELIPLLIQDELELMFKLAGAATWHDTATQTILVTNLQVIVEWYDVPENVLKEYASAYQGGFEFTILQTPKPTEEAISGTVQKNLDLDLTYRCPFLAVFVVDESADVQEAALDFSAITQYKVVDSSGQTLFQTNGSEYVYLNDYNMMIADQVNSTFLRTKNIYIIPCGCASIREAIRQQSYQGAFQFKSNERLYITSSDSNADKLIIIPYYWSKVGIVGGRFTTIADL